MAAATSDAPRRSFLGTGEQVSWYFYDWANSAFSTTVVAVFMGPYLTSVTRAAADAEGFVHPLGIGIRADAFFPFVVSLSVLLQVLILPIIGAVADYTHLKKRILGVFAYIGAFATMGLYFVNGDNYLFGGLLFLIANLSFGAAMVCYNAFLPEISGPDERDRETTGRASFRGIRMRSAALRAVPHTRRSVHPGPRGSIDRFRSRGGRSRSCPPRRCEVSASGRYRPPRRPASTTDRAAHRPRGKHAWMSHPSRSTRS